jgi:hypothetical protein
MITAKPKNLSVLIRSGTKKTEAKSQVEDLDTVHVSSRSSMIDSRLLGWSDWRLRTCPCHMDEAEYADIGFGSGDKLAKSERASHGLLFTVYGAGRAGSQAASASE